MKLTKMESNLMNLKMLFEYRMLVVKSEEKAGRPDKWIRVRLRELITIAKEYEG